MNVKLPKFIIRMSQLMIYACVICYSVSMVFGSESIAQRKQLSEIEIVLTEDHNNLIELIHVIERTKQFGFSYTRQDLKSKEINIRSGNWTMDMLLSEMSVQAGLSFRRINEDITIRVAESGNKFPIVEEEVSLQVSVSGTITDESGETLPGATIQEKGTSNGTITDVDGKFSLQVPQDAVLTVSFVGYQTQEILVNNRSVIDVQMSVDAEQLEEVVVVGYGTNKKSDIINSVVSIDTEALTKAPSLDIGEMLKGRATGVYVTLADASPGSSSNILIRGKSSINGGNSPLIIADGVPMFNLNDINPYDIASVEILKDAAAQAIYGARASNGVILITTKRGKSGVTKVDYRGYYGVQDIQQNFDVYNGEEFAQLRREAVRTANNDNYLPDADIFTPIELEVLNSGEFINWREEVLRTGSIQNHNMSISSGTDNNRIYSSIDFMKHDGVVPGTDYHSLGIRLNFDQKLTNWLTMGANTSWKISQNNDPGTGNTLKWLVTASPLGKIYNDDGSLRLYPSGVQESINPLLDLETVSNLKKDQNSIMNVYFDVSPFKNFNYRLNASYLTWNRERESYSTAESFTGIRVMDGQGSGSLEYIKRNEWQVENIFTYDLETGKNNLGFTFVQSTIQNRRNYFINESRFFPNDILGIYGLRIAEFNQPSIDAFERRLLSFMGRIQYDFDGKYYANVSMRSDGSTVFGANNKWGYFPALSLGWNMHRESFIQEVSLISNLKLRVSYGSVGNEAISPYQSQSVAQQRDYLLNGRKLTGYIPGSVLPNPDLRWETSTTLNTAIDFGLWNDRLSGTIEIYNTRTTDLLVDRALNAASGYTVMKSNIGEVENKGVELMLNGVIVDKRDLVINVGVNISTNKNKIISLYGELDDEGNEVDDVGNLWFIGEPIDVYYQYKAIGIFQVDDDIANSHQPDAEPGDLMLFDRYPDDGELNADDRVITKQNPDWYGSINYNMRFKNFDLNIDVLTVQGVVRNNDYLWAYNSGGSLRAVLNGIKQDYWTPENPGGNWPRPDEVNDPSYNGSQGLQDASYIRLQTVELGYNFPTDRLNSIRVYVAGRNLLTLTDFQSYSPEQSVNAYPEATSIMGGLQVSF